MLTLGIKPLERGPSGEEELRGKADQVDYPMCDPVHPSINITFRDPEIQIPAFHPTVNKTISQRSPEPVP